MGRFETEWLASDASLETLADVLGVWIDRVHARKPPDGIILDIDSFKSQTHGEQKASAWNGHFGCRAQARKSGSTQPWGSLRPL